jgi:tight adherence protein B
VSGVRVLAAGLSAGVPLERALAMSDIGDGPDRITVDDILELARHTGVPRARVLTDLADSRDEAESRISSVSAASASARQTIRILTLLPLATAVAAQWFGFDVIGVLALTPLGWACLALGAGLTLAAWKWMVNIQQRMPNPSAHLGLILALAAGITVSSGLTQAHRQALANLAQKWGTEAELDDVDRHRRLSRETGVPVAGLLKVEAELVRRRARAGVRHAIELLPGRLLAPVGVCLFPAFIVTTVIPVVASMIGDFVG